MWNNVSHQVIPWSRRQQPTMPGSHLLYSDQRTHQPWGKSSAVHFTKLQHIRFRWTFGGISQVLHKVSKVWWPHQQKLIAIRCHPNYQGRGYPWYDWAIIRYADDDDNHQEYPSRILSCIPRNIVEGHDETTFDLIIQCCDKPTGCDSICSQSQHTRKASMLSMPLQLFLSVLLTSALSRMEPFLW